jgi:hypothetical protein
MSTTARDIINQAMKDGPGTLGLGQTLNDEDINDGFTKLLNMINQWQKRRWLVPSLYDIAMPGNSQISNRIGPGQYWNTLRPDKILAAYFLQPANGSTPVSFPLWPILSYEGYSKVPLKTLNSWPTWYFYDNQYPYGNVFITPIPNETYEIHLILKSQLGFSTSIIEGTDGGTITDGGTGYTDAVYAAVPMVNVGTTQVGISVTADITVAGGIVTAVSIINGGQFNKIGDTLTCEVIGAGTDFIWTANELTSNLDSIIELPEEYNEALIFNLAERLCIGYQQPVSNDLRRLARASLKTITGANTQVPTLSTGRVPGRRRAGIVNVNGGVVWGDVA